MLSFVTTALGAVLTYTRVQRRVVRAVEEVTAPATATVEVDLHDVLRVDVAPSPERARAALDPAVDPARLARWQPSPATVAGHLSPADPRLAGTFFLAPNPDFRGTWDAAVKAGVLERRLAFVAPADLDWARAAECLGTDEHHARALVGRWSSFRGPDGLRYDRCHPGGAFCVVVVDRCAPSDLVETP